MSANDNLPPLPGYYPAGATKPVPFGWFTADQMREYARAAIAAHEQQPKFLGLKQPEPAFKVYVHEVPDHCDRIVWRGEYRNILSMPSDSPWRPIDSAPKDGTRIIVACMDGVSMITQWVAGWGWPQLRVQEVATHWMPIPPLPEVK